MKMQYIIIVLFLYCATKYPMEAEKLTMQKYKLTDFGGQNETDKYSRISFLVLLRLTFKKTMDNTSKIKAKNSCKNQSENKKSNCFSRAKKFYYGQREERWKL